MLLAEDHLMLSLVDVVDMVFSCRNVYKSLLMGHTGHAAGNRVAGGGGGGGSPDGSGAGGAGDSSAGVGGGPWNAGAGRGGNSTESVPVLNGDGYVDAKASTGADGSGNYAVVVREVVVLV